MMAKIWDLAYEVDSDGGINLEQDAGCGDVERITLHPIHVRLLAEQAGILAPSSNIEADRTIARLCRQMRLLLERINYLDDWLHTCSDTAHADLSYEQTYSMATWELAREFVDDLPDVAGPVRRAAAPPAAVPQPITVAAPPNAAPPEAFQKNQTTKSKGRGGARPGAGRKPASKTSAAAPVPGPATVILRAEANVPIAGACPPAEQLGLLERTAAPSHPGGVN